jgi:uncharacterized membrane protein YeaQ/YmgE (transglycosylase-associated protein family)
MQIFFWSIFGAVTGWYTGKFMLSQGRGQWMTVLVGIAAAIGGGMLFDATSFHWEGKMIYTSLVSIMAAVVLTVLYQYVVVRHEFSPASR